MKSIFRLFFRLLYHQFAFTYDLVAAAVSFNRWKHWVMSVVPFIEGDRVLEIGHGPGHLQRVLSSRGWIVVGIDESAQMGRLARRNIARESLSSLPPQLQISSSSDLHQSPQSPQLAYTQISLTRGLAQQLPFPDDSFDTVVATFPTEYMTDPDTLAEVQRCLVSAGRFVILPVAMPRNRILVWLFRVTHQAPSEAVEMVRSKLKEPFAGAGFEAEVRTLEVKSGILLVVIARKPSR